MKCLSLICLTMITFGSFSTYAKEVTTSVDAILKAKSVRIEWPSMTVDGQKRMFLAANATLVHSGKRRGNFDLNTDYAVSDKAKKFCIALGFSAASNQYEAVEVGYKDEMANQFIQDVDSEIIVSKKIVNVSTALVQDGLTHYSPVLQQPFAIFKMLRCKK